MEQSGAQTTTSMTESDAERTSDDSVARKEPATTAATHPSASVNSRIADIVGQFNTAKAMWKITGERDLLRIPSTDIVDVSLTMFRLLQSLSATVENETSPVARKKGFSAAPIAKVPTQGTNFGSPGTNGDLGNDSFAGEGVLGGIAETNGDAGDGSEYSEASTPYQPTHLISPPLAGANPGPQPDREVFKLTEDALQRLNDIPGVLISGLVGPEVHDSDNESDDVSDTRMSVSRSDVHDDGIFDGVNDYILLEEIGRGQAGKVFKAMDTRTNQIVAIKILPRHLVVEPRRDTTRKSQSLVVPDGESATTIAETKFKKEVLIMKKLKHKNIARLIEVIDDVDEKQVYLVMPLLEGGPIISFTPQRTCEPLPADVVRRYLMNIVSGLQYLKKHRIVHRDLKPDNVILSNGVAILVDFGQSEWATGADGFEEANDPLASSGSDAGGPTVRVRNLGTPAFMAPEVIRGEKPDFPSDVWSLGVILYAMLYGKLPFRGVFAGRRGQQASNGAPDLLDEIMYRDPELDEDEVDFVWNDLITMMLEKNPQERGTLSDIKRHAAMTGGPGSRSVSSAASCDLDASGLTPRDFGELDAAVTERRRSTSAAFSPPKVNTVLLQHDADGSLNFGSCLQSPVQRLPAHQRLPRFKLSGAKGGGGGQPSQDINEDRNNVSLPTAALA